MRLKWSPLARRDLREAIDYIAEDNPRAADAMEDGIFAAARTLIDHPQKGRSGRRAGTREWMAPKTPYLLIYRQTAEMVEIVRVWHTSREPFA